MRWRSLSLLGLVLGLLFTAAAAALAATSVSRDRADLDRALESGAHSGATALERWFEVGRAAALTTATDPNVRRAVLADRRQDGRAEAALGALLSVVPGLEEAALLTASGRVLVRVGHGPARPTDAPARLTAALPRPGGTIQTAPFDPAGTGSRRIATIASVRAAGRTVGAVRLESSIGAATAPTVSATDPDVTLDVVDAGTGLPLGDRSGVVAPPSRLAGAGEATFDAGDRRVSTVRVAVAAGNANRWLAAAASARTSLPASIGIVPPALFLVGCLVLTLTALELRRADRRERHARLEAEQRSRMDPLTGLYNRRHAVEAITTELSRAARERSAPAVLVLDIDHFKQVNDVYGHQAGDLVIQEIGKRIRSSVRDYDLVARWGGEEFAVLLPGSASVPEVRAAAERIRNLVAYAPVRLADHRSLSVTVSIGGAIAGESTSTAEGLVESADRALYAAKRRGRNQTVLFTDMSKDDIAAEEPEAIRLAQGLALAVTVREASPEEHCEEVADLSARIAERLGLSDSVVMRCRLGGWVHDVGKLAIPDRIIAKPTALDDEERKILHSHVTLGAEIIRRIAGVRDAASAVLHHHERWDGSGYPDRLSGHAIPIEARIVACADAFSAITTGRPYQAPLSAAAAVEQLRRSAGQSLDPVVVEALAELVAHGAAASGEPAAAPA